MRTLYCIGIMGGLLLATACGDDVGAADAGFDGGLQPRDGAVGRVELGTGQANFEEIPLSGAELEVVAGPQGGWHVFVSCRLYDLTIDDMLLSYRIERDGQVISMPTQYRLSERRLVHDGARWLRVGDLAIFDIGGPDEVVGDVVDVIVVAEPPDGPAVSDMRTGTLVDRDP